MDKDTIIIPDEDIEIIDMSEYKEDLAEHFTDVSDAVRPLINKAEEIFSYINREVRKAPAFIEVVKSSFPDVKYEAIFTDEQKKQLKDGVVELMTKKDGSILAKIRNPETKRIVKNITLKKVETTPELNHAMANLNMQMQMAEISEQMRNIQVAIEEVRLGQEYDRLADADSCNQKFLQAMSIDNPALKENALLMLAYNAEESRNRLMRSQEANVEWIKKQPKGMIMKMLKGDSSEKVNQRLSEIRESLIAVNATSFIEAMAYKEIGEQKAALESLMHYKNYINGTYLSAPGLVDRLDSIDPSTEKYWSKRIPVICEKIDALPTVEDMGLLKEN